MQANPFDYSTVGAAMPEAYGATAPITDPLVNAVMSAVSLPKRTIDAATEDVQPDNFRDPNYQMKAIGPALEAAMLPMGTGAIAGVPVRGAEAVFGAGPIRAYHGSPHDFNAFSLDKVGTGEGAQQEGHGLYFAENPETAKFYKDKEAAKRDVPGRTYEVNINADPSEFIDRNAPFEQQPKAVKDFIAKNNINLSNDLYNPSGPYKGTDVQRAITNHLWEEYGSKHPDIDPLQLSYKDASDYVARRAAEEGIPGVKYLDLGSKEAGEGTRNYVVFNDKLIDIMRKYGMVGAIPAAGAAGFGTLAQQGQPQSGL